MYKPAVGNSGEMVRKVDLPLMKPGGDGDPAMVAMPWSEFRAGSVVSAIVKVHLYDMANAEQCCLTYFRSTAERDYVGWTIQVQTVGLVMPPIEMEPQPGVLSGSAPLSGIDSDSDDIDATKLWA